MSTGTYYYAREIEPSLLDVNIEQVSSSLIPQSFQNFNIIQFSDTHVGFHFTVKQMRKVVQKINEKNPDLIVFTGDLVDEPQTFNEQQALINELKKLAAPFGKYWIYGNHDHGGYGTDMILNIMEQAEFRLLKNSHVLVEKDYEQIVLAGIDDVILGNPDLQQTLQHVDPNLYTILLAHEPDFVNKTVHSDVNIQLSGHSHGGQVRVPFIGHLYTPVYAEEFVVGKYNFENDLTLFVSKGIGTTRLPFRFFCKPEINSFILNHIPK